MPPHAVPGRQYRDTLIGVSAAGSFRGPSLCGKWNWLTNRVAHNLGELPAEVPRGLMMIHGIAETLHLSRAETAGVIATGLSAIGGLASAFAAWRAAKISALSVVELREARNQSIRPTFLVSGERRFRVSIGRSSIALADDTIGGGEIESGRSYGCFKALNVGLGLAKDLRGSFRWDGPPLREVQLRRVEEFLARNEIRITDQGPLEEGRLYGPFVLGYVGIQLPAACPPQEAMDIPVTHFDLQALLVKTIASSLSDSGAVSDVFGEAGDMTLSYTSLSGEKASQVTRVSATGYLLIREGTLKDGWSRLDAFLSFAALVPGSGYPMLLDDDSTIIYPQPRTRLMRLLWLARGRRVPRYGSDVDQQWPPFHRLWLRRKRRREFRRRVRTWWHDAKGR